RRGGGCRRPRAGTWIPSAKASSACLHPFGPPLFHANLCRRDLHAIRDDPGLVSERVPRRRMHSNRSSDTNGNVSAFSLRPFVGPGNDRRKFCQELGSEWRQAVAGSAFEIDEPVFAQLAQPVVEHGGTDPARCILQHAKRAATVAQLPQYAHGPAPSEKVE